MKRTIRLALVSGVAVLLAGCGVVGGGGGATAGAGGAGTSTFASSTRNFDVRVKCPAVEYMKKQGKSNQQIMAKLNLEAVDIANCQNYVASLPKGYVPPPPKGVAVKAPAPKKSKK